MKRKKKISKNKKAFIFTTIFMIIFAIIVSISSSSMTSTRVYLEEHKWQNLIQEEMNRLISLESSELPSVIRTITYCSLDYLLENDYEALVEDAEHSPTEEILDLVIKNLNDYFIGSKSTDGTCVNFNSFASELEDAYGSSNLKLDIKTDNVVINISEDVPFFIRVNATIPYSFYLLNNEDVFKINRTAEISTLIPIAGILDPASIIYLEEPRRITFEVGPSRQMINYEDEFGVTLDPNDLDLQKCYDQYLKNFADFDCLEKTVNRKWFYYSGYAPSFMNRLSLDFSPSICCGIYTVLDKNEVMIINQTVPKLTNDGIYNWSYVDYCQYQENPTTNCFHSNSSCKWYVIENVTVDGILQEIIIDAYHYVDILNETAFASHEPDPYLYEKTNYNCIGLEGLG